MTQIKPINRSLITVAILTALLAPLGVSAAVTSPQTAAPAAVAPASLAAHGDVVETLMASGQFTILAKALDATNLTSVLKSQNPITLIAPTDAAFQAMPATQLDTLMKPENAQQLQNLLAYHVINTAVPLSAVQGTKGPLQTVGGGKVVVDGSASPIRFNDAAVTAVSQASNGTIYVVDKVLSPSNATASLKPAGPISN